MDGVGGSIIFIWFNLRISNSVYLYNKYPVRTLYNFPKIESQGLVGLASYLLINFWWTRVAANIAALKAFLMNRVGDMALSIGLL